MDNDARSWNAFYDETGYRFGTAANPFVVECVQMLRPGRVLSIGEGEGRNAVWLAEQGFAVCGIDQSEVAIEKARRLAAERGVDVEFLVADLTTFTLELQAWDVIVSSYAHMPSALRERVHAGVVAALKPGGHFILSACNPRQLGRHTRGPTDADLLVSLEDARRELAGLEFVTAREVEVPTSRDGQLLDPGAITLLFARKPNAD